MSVARLQSIRQQAPAAGILIAALLAAWFAYSPGITGAVYFDDQANLGGLAEVSDLESAWRFILSGRAGPLGRPLALASFAPEAPAWPQEPEVFLRTNILIHLLNGVLVTWFLYLLGTARHHTERQAALIATGSGGIWILLPILASSSFFIVQRMTTLSALFVLLGAIAYFYARRTLNQRPVLALFGMTLALGLGVIFAALAKESGALLLIFVLAVEATLLRRPADISLVLWRSWFAAILVLPGIILLAYLATRIPYPESVIMRRDFNGFERLLTQAGILWKYLYLAFLPNLPALGPFHDDYPVQRDLLKLTALLAVAAWIAAIAAAIVLRRKAPLFSFAVSWYLLGHALESTTIPLELYFEHRNYLPLVGPVYALIASILHVTTAWRRWLIIAVAGYALVLGGVLYSVASLWGTPAIAAEMWYIYKPTSIRAAERIAQQMEREGNLQVSRKIFREVREKNPNAHHLDLPILLISCVLEPNVDHSDDIASLEYKLRTTRFSHSVVGLLQTFYNLIHSGVCLGMDKEDVYRLGQSVLDNPQFHLSATTQVIRTLMAQIAIDHDDVALAIVHVKEALRVEPDPETLKYLVNMLNRARQYDVADEVLAYAHTRELHHPARDRLWELEIERLDRAQAQLKNNQLSAPVEVR